ncbi:MAG: hypothetical protein RLZZ612_1930 [Pseudomonadota bacterium]|jgi:diguanylate cyclase (GGDEF)-like protein/PAS domain S-box-containing protein
MNALPSSATDLQNERWLAHAIAATAVLALLVVLGLAAILGARSHKDALGQAQSDVQRVVSTTEADLNRNFVAIDALLVEVSHWVASGRLNSSDVAHHTATQRLLRATLNQTLMLRDVLVVDAQGGVLVSGRNDVRAAHVDPHFLAQIVQQSYPALVFGQPKTHVLSTEQILHLGRSAKSADGRTVAVVAELKIALLSAQLDPRDRDGRIQVTLEHTAGTLLAAYPPQHLVEGTRILPPSLAELTEPRIWDLPHRLNPTLASWVAVRPLLYPDIWVSASIGQEVALADWRDDVRAITGVALALALLILSLWWGGVRYAHRIATAQLQIAQAHKDLLDSHQAQGRSNAMLKATLEATADAVLVVDHHGVVTQFNSRYVDVLNLTPERLAGATVQELRALLNPLLNNAADVTAVALRAYDEPDSETLDELRFHDGRVFLRHSLPQIVEGVPVGRVWSYQEITAFRQIEKRLRQREYALNQARDELAATLEALPDLLFELNEDGLYLDARMSESERRLFPLQSFLGKRVCDVHPAATAAQVMACLAQAKQQGSAYGVQIKLTTPKRVRWFELSAARKPTPPDELARFVVIARDITDRKESEALIWEQAHFDALTGLPNRNMFREGLARHLHPYLSGYSAPSDTRLALFFIDLDRFKEINDTHGHDMGDLLLQQAAQRIRSCVREEDLVARLGGDEFTLVVPDVQQTESIERIARELLDRLNEPFDLGGEREYISASIGVTLCPDDGVDSDTLVRHADQAMYAAKHGGRNRWERFTTALEEAATVKARTARDLRTALNDQQFEVYYQPIVHLSTQRVLKAEALLRWKHPLWGDISPAQFVPVAEETGQIQEIGHWVLEQVTTQVQQWRTHLDPDFQISVNQSAVQFRQGRQENGTRRWTARLAELGLPGDSIALEITETVLMDASESTRLQLDQLHKAGIKLALDDFGTGYSALSYLHRYDLDWLKIDQAFVRHLDTSHKDLALCKATIAMAHALGLQVVAEGIETQIQCQLLTQLGCDAGQGFLFARPMPAAAFEQWFLRRSSGYDPST